MKCPKCGYNSFEHLDDCKKCGQDLSAHKDKFNLRGFYAAGQSTAPVITETTVDETPEEETSADEPVDFGFDFLDEEDKPAGDTPESLELSNDSEDVSIEQPFGADSETIPANDLSADENADATEDKTKQGSEFSF
jgi:DNA-directed RNA polymerase delta subunit